MGRIYHVTVQRDLWAEIPKHVTTGEHVVRVAGTNGAGPKRHLPDLAARGERWDLLVVPPEFDAEAAERLMANVATPGNLQSASALLGRAKGRKLGGLPVEADASCL